MEMIAVSMMFPLIEVLSSPNATPSMSLAAALHKWINPASHADFAFWLLALLVAFYFAKNLFFGLLFYLQNRFGFHKQSKLSNRLFAHYLNLPYTFHLQRNSADLVRNLTHETDQIVWSLLIPGLTLITEALIAMGLVILLFYSSFQPAIVICTIFGFTGSLYYLFFRNSLATWGESRIQHDGLRMRAIHEAFGSLKELKVLGRGGYFLNRYTHHNQSRARFASKHNLVLNSNLLLLEVLGISSLLILVGLHLAQGQPFETILPMMGVFAGAAFRLIPATNRIINNFQQIQYSGPILNNLCQELSHANQPETASPPQTLKFEHALTLKDVHFRYAEDRPEVIKGISLTIPKGQTIGLMGASGTGKTTLIDILLGILPPSQGQILVDGTDISHNPTAWQKLVGYIPQTIYLLDGTIRQNVAFALKDENIDNAKVLAALEDAQLDDYITALPLGIHTPVGEWGKQLSGGQRQRIGIARALYHQPEVLVFDEATSSLDSQTEAEVINSIRAMHNRKTIIMITHRLSTLDNSNFIYRIHKGKLE